MACIELSGLQSLFQLAVALNIALVGIETVLTPPFYNSFSLYNSILSKLIEHNRRHGQSDNDLDVIDTFELNSALLRVFENLSAFKAKDSRLVYWLLPYFVALCAAISFLLLLISSAYSARVSCTFLLIPCALNLLPIFIVCERYFRARKYVVVIEPALALIRASIRAD